VWAELQAHLTTELGDTTFDQLVLAARQKTQDGTPPPA
jgi:hypothetical protein